MVPAELCIVPNNAIHFSQTRYRQGRKRQAPFGILQAILVRYNTRMMLLCLSD